MRVFYSCSINAICTLRLRVVVGELASHVSEQPEYHERLESAAYDNLGP